MTRKCRVRISRDHFEAVYSHLFPGDGDEHGTVLLAGLSSKAGEPTLHVREVHNAVEGVDYVEGRIGYRALTPTFIHRVITRARDQRLVYLAAHNHGTDREVGFSSIDMDSHERGYPALLQIARGMPVGALVLGRRSMEVDLWMPSGDRCNLSEAAIVGSSIKRLTARPTKSSKAGSATHDRQLRMFGHAGQLTLAECRVAIIGLGGIGSLLGEYLARLGVSNFILIDDDRVEASNLSRIVGARADDAADAVRKVDVAERHILESNPNAVVQSIADDVAKESIAKAITGCDYLFLAADSMRARLVVNAIVHQYLIPAVQLGAKVRPDASGSALAEVMSVNRPIRPGNGCLLCNQLIDPTQLAKEAKSDDERRAQAYGIEEPNPSVITLNAVAAAHAANDFLLDYLGLRPEPKNLYYEQFHFLKRSRSQVEPRRSLDCSECSHGGLRFGRGDGVPLPCIEG